MSRATVAGCHRAASRNVARCNGNAHHPTPGRNSAPPMSNVPIGGHKFKSWGLRA
jgi:hypothetical protein